MAFILRVHLPFLRFSRKEWSKIGHFYKKIIIFVNFRNAEKSMFVAVSVGRCLAVDQFC